MPGVFSPASAAAGLAALGAGVGSFGIFPGPVGNPVSGAPVVHAEPPLPCYVFASCPPSATLHVTVRPARAVLHHRTRLHILVTVDVSGVVSPVPGASVWVGNGRHLHTTDDGRATITLAFGRRGHRRVIATAPEYRRGERTVRVS